ncbi:hypothetical protein [Streptomyces aidingensis]|uniref:Up-regulated in Daf-2 domain-containing protein n=1 Tax=Streptomyces aidingensis TaxID=910347 RepID=A0A1I1MV97_9ACTN|nr:hypothetical protein [Streptomyces aidingensis]SFC89036.1 hypothetical protein SAMN05421773_10771 [Streptomyces aidingensis]
MAVPNSWLPVEVVNNWGGTITSLTANHRYDTDHYDHHSWESVENGKTASGMQAGFWTGFLRTGKDYWNVVFRADGQNWTCKENFYCFLTSDDASSGRAVRLTISKNNLHVAPPESSSCDVSLHQVG